MTRTMVVLHCFITVLTVLFSCFPIGVCATTAAPSNSTTLAHNHTLTHNYTTPVHHNRTFGDRQIVSSPDDWPTCRCSCTWVVFTTMIVQSCVMVVFVALFIGLATVYSATPFMQTVDRLLNRMSDTVLLWSHRDASEPRSRRFHDLSEDYENPGFDDERDPNVTVHAF